MDSPCGITNRSQSLLFEVLTAVSVMSHTARSTLRCKRDVTWLHEQSVIPVDYVACAVNCPADHIVQKNIFLGIGVCLRWDGDRIQLVISVINVTLTITLSDTACRTEWGNLLTRSIHASCLAQE